MSSTNLPYKELNSLPPSTKVPASIDGYGRLSRRRSADYEYEGVVRIGGHVVYVTEELFTDPDRAAKKALRRYAKAQELLFKILDNLGEDD